MATEAKMTFREYYAARVDGILAELKKITAIILVDEKHPFSRLKQLEDAYRANRLQLEMLDEMNRHVRLEAMRVVFDRAPKPPKADTKAQVMEVSAKGTSI